MPIHKYFNNSYFDIYKNTNVGNEEFNLTPDELAVLILPFINITDLMDRCSINKHNLSKLLIKLLINLDDTYINFFDTNDLNLNYHLKLTMLKHKIPTVEKYDYTVLFNNFIKQYNEHNYENIAKYKKIVSLHDKNNNTMLTWACKTKKAEDNIILLLTFFKELCKPECISKCGNTALIWACNNKMENVALKLIDEFGELCKPDCITVNGNTALMLACSNKMENVALKLINEFGELCKPNKINYVDEIGELCKPDCINKNGNTALILACGNKMENVALKLIDKFGELCEPECISKKYNMTALSWACMNTMENVALKLINEFGELCKPDCISEYGNTALIWACTNNMENVALKLINEFGELCKPDCINHYGETALLWAFNNNMENVVLKLNK
jgi:ankyrin repeat protein